MKKLNKYLVYIDNGKQTTSKALTATSKKSVMKALEGQGEVVAVKNLTEDHPLKADTIREVLQASGKFDKLELDWIIHALTMTGIVTDGTEPQPEVKKEPKPESKAEQKPKARKPRTDARQEAKPAAPKQEVKPEVKPMEEKKSA